MLSEPRAFAKPHNVACVSRLTVANLRTLLEILSGRRAAWRRPPCGRCPPLRTNRISTRTNAVSGAYSGAQRRDHLFACRIARRKRKPCVETDWPIRPCDPPQPDSSATAPPMPKARRAKSGILIRVCSCWKMPDAPCQRLGRALDSIVPTELQSLRALGLRSRATSPRGGLARVECGH